MKKTLMILSALVMVLALVIGSVSVVSAKGGPVRTAVAAIDSVNATGFYVHWMWDGYGAWGYQLLIYDLDDSAGAKYTMDVSWQEKRTTYKATNNYPSPVHYGFDTFPPNPTHHFAIQLTLFKKNGDILEQVSSSWSPILYTVTFNNTQELLAVWMKVYTDSEYSNGVGGEFWTNASGQATKNLPNGTYYYKAVKAGYFQYFSDAFTVAGANLTISYTLTPAYTVTFNETNGLGGVSIELYSDPDRTEGAGSCTTNATGQATREMADGTYYYTATMTSCPDLLGDFTVSGAPLTVSLTLTPVYTVTFDETNSLPDVSIAIWDDIAKGWVDNIATNETGQATIDLQNSDYIYFAMKSGHASVTANFTVSGSPQTISFTMVPVYTVTFNETTPLSDVEITVYDMYSNLMIDVVTTNGIGQATIDLPSGDYYYSATKSEFVEFWDGFTVPGSGPIISFTMIPGYAVTFDEANGVSDVYIDIWDEIADQWYSCTTNGTGQATITLGNSTYDFYASDDYWYHDFDGNFTVSGEALTVPFEMIPYPTVTFNETNGVSYVWITLYADSALTVYVTDFSTDESGQLTIPWDEEAGTYYYEAIAYGYGNLVGSFAISDSDIIEGFTMNTGYTVGFQEANYIGVWLQLYSDSGLTAAASPPFVTDETGWATIDFADGTYYYKATEFRSNDCTGNFTVSGASQTVNFEMIPLTDVIFAEDFTGIASYDLPDGWTTNDAPDCYVSYSNYARGFAPELRIDWTGYWDTYSDYYVATLPINATGTSTALNLTFKHYFDLYGDDPGHTYTYAVQTSDNGGANWTTVVQESPNFGTYPYGYFQRTETIDLSACVGQTIRICWRLTGYTYWMDHWYIDDVIVRGS